MADPIVIPGTVAYPQGAGQPGSWHYQTGRSTPRLPVVALLVAAGIHAGLLLINDGASNPIAPPAPTPPGTIEVIPRAADLEEPEVAPVDAPREKLEPASYVPVLPEVPSPVTREHFVQSIDYTALTPTRDARVDRIATIPAGRITNRVSDVAESIFDPSQLERVPEAVYQPPPSFPAHLKKEAPMATVTVEFVVSADGKVASARVLESSHTGFDDAAVRGVMRWQFRPGMKNGRRVATRMIVPLIFRVEE